MNTRNVTHPQYSQLPDAPVVTELESYVVQSPHHVGCISSQQQSFVMAGLRNLACLFVAERSSGASGCLDFSLDSLLVVDRLIDKVARDKELTQEQLESFVSQCGAYVGTCLEYHFQRDPHSDARWYPSFPSFCFSSFRFPMLKEGVRVVGETNPFAVVTRHLLQLIQNKGINHPSVVEYSRQICG